MESIWSEEHEASLVQLIVGETKYRIIATQLGRSINSICAKVNRMRKEGQLPGKPARQARSAKRVPGSQKAAEAEEGAKRSADYGGFKYATEEMEQEAAALEGKLLSLADLPDDGCHYVVGDPRETEHVYCNGKAVLPGVPGKCYCAKHLARMFNTPAYNPTTPTPIYRGPARQRRSEFVGRELAF